MSKVDQRRELLLKSRTSRRNAQEDTRGYDSFQSCFAKNDEDNLIKIWREGLDRSVEYDKIAP